MQQIDCIKIISITVTGFRCFGETTSFSCGDMTIITGANGKGKSSLADAIAYAFCGTGFFGDRSLDRLQNPQYDGMEVYVTFAGDFGELHKLYRGHRAGKTSLTLDGVPLTQAALVEMIGEKDLFLSILNPLYFVEVMGDKGRALLEPFMACVPEEDIWLALPEETATLLPKEGLPSPETYIKNQRAAIRDSEREHLYTEAQLDFAVDRSDNFVMMFNPARENVMSFAVDLVDKLIFQSKEITSEPIAVAIEQKKKLVAAAQAYSAKKFELLFQRLQTEPNGQGLAANRVTLSLYEVMSSTGEVKDDFSFLYNGIPYSNLSLSEKVRAGIAISELVKRIAGKNYPVFIDNSESICVIDNVRPTGQTFFARVAKGEALQVKSQAMSTQTAVKAA